MEIVESSPPYDWAEQASLISVRVVLDTLASMVRTGQLGKKAATQRKDAWGRFVGVAAAAGETSYPLS